jgi:PadR family transcriptional regulator AphA
MSIKQTILGFLSWKPFTGYELKKFFADSLSFYWSGNNNQIYGSLIELHREGSVSIEILQQEKYPAKKVYAITDKGKKELRAWLLSEPEIPQLRNLFHIRLSWTEALGIEELVALLEGYVKLIETEILMYRELARRGSLGPARSEREAFVWKAIEQGRIRAFEVELDWARSLQGGLTAFA